MKNGSVMLRILRTFALACCAAGMTTCNNSPTEVVSVPGATVAGDTATFVTTSGAILSATVNPVGEPTTCYFELGPTTAYGTQLGTHNVGSGNVPVTVLDTVTNLAQGTTYHFRAVASNVSGVIKAADRTFITGTPRPLITIDSVVKLSQTSVMLKGTVNPEGYSTSYHFEYGTSTSYGQNTTLQDAGSGTAPVKVSATLINLSLGATYHWRVVAVNSGGTSTTPDSTFTTPSLVAPELTLNAVMSSSATSVVVEGTVNPMGLSTSYHFEYGSTSSYGQSTSLQAAGFGITPVSVSATIGNLAPAGTYHWRLVAVSIGGAAVTSDSTFTTPVDFAFPLAVGTTWTYGYNQVFSYPATLDWRVYNGVHIWQIVSASTRGDSVIYSAIDMQTDTVHYLAPQKPDAVTTQVNPFTIVETTNAVTVNAPELTGSQENQCPRYIQPSLDTLTSTYGNLSCTGAEVWYARSVGVVRYSFADNGCGINSIRVEMRLLSVSKP